MPEKGTIGHGKAANSIYKSRTGSNRTGSNREALGTITPVPPGRIQKKTSLTDATSEGTQTHLWPQRPNGKVCINTKPGKQLSTTYLQLQRENGPHDRVYIIPTTVS